MGFFCSLKIVEKFIGQKQAYPFATLHSLNEDNEIKIVTSGLFVSC